MLAGCGETNENIAADIEQPANSGIEVGNNEQGTSGDAEQEAPAAVVYPLPDTTMENLSDAILSVSLEEGGAYVDDTGKMQMEVKVFNYDRYDMVDISALKAGDTVVTHAGEVEVTAMERSDSGIIYINGGLEEGGFDLVTDESGVFYEVGFNDAKNWYEVGEATIRVSADFEGLDNADPEKGEVVLYPGDFLTGAVADYNFAPYNTTVRVEGGQIVELNRIFTP
jgi:hypothetical protein